ncbi:hypothetical protein SAMN05192558_106290 [Actinokineospora alba]|uniref:Uncharacterized protein n=1 Tax=Actinokineospora alba TaxID=504798 RepID=A0A1H0PWH4_9PSEU|nr:hypothetical protein C8E96_1457 [Actinokineospora alba]SDI61220.1 hypothetical protein SAMN05421871_106162 [Actinokineospora alba]SDP09150.1 hypothetical protein SAMN05192558_106290 [Actinokineospora alba]
MLAELAISSADEWPVARRSLSKWLLRRDVPELLTCDVVMAAEEALGLAGPVSIVVEASETDVVLRIVGHGPIPPGALPMLRASVDRFELVREGDRTTVIASFPLPRSESA